MVPTISGLCGFTAATEVLMLVWPAAVLTKCKHYGSQHRYQRSCKCMPAAHALANPFEMCSRASQAPEVLAIRSALHAQNQRPPEGHDPAGKLSLRAWMHLSPTRLVRISTAVLMMCSCSRCILVLKLIVISLCRGSHYCFL